MTDSDRYGKWNPDEEPCRKCDAQAVQWRKVTSHDGAHDDCEIYCTACRYTRWVDGSDS